LVDVGTIVARRAHVLSNRYTVGAIPGTSGSWPVKKGRHRRFEEARALKHTNDLDIDAILDQRDAEPCAECGAVPGHDHASWCLREENDDDGLWPS
jgi:hypothetical protein